MGINSKDKNNNKNSDDNKKKWVAVIYFGGANPGGQISPYAQL
jgi:hypothetical protein